MNILDLPARVELATLRAAFPEYQFRMITDPRNRRRYEAVLRRDCEAPIYCLMSVSPREIWLELAESRKAAAAV